MRISSPRAGPRSFSISWTAMSLIFVAGGVLVTGFSVAVLDLLGEVSGHTLLFLGSLVGGTFASASADERRVAEALVGTCLVAALMLLLQVSGMTPWG